MKKIVIFSLAILMLFSLGSIAGAKTLKLGLDAGRLARDARGLALAADVPERPHLVRIDPLNPASRGRLIPASSRSVIPEPSRGTSRVQHGSRQVGLQNLS